ncbi:AAA family ATPase [Hydrogenibacillus sp. N12]|uniref:nucleotide-binding protein n=1 Tax=Hydrogenibacillus sp. N12 TaxID=2866627 RepID=UPI001C7D6915|nr:AAA family ATPase [Hydrogenibacillus sp. N12]QZA33518.1 AAA family ATPase [Hydrogenibacillus sp. N12]
MNGQADRLRALMERAQAVPPTNPVEAGRRPTVTLAVASGKGGVGKSHVAVGLAGAFSALGRRTVLIDADLGFANADVLLGIRPQATLADVAAGRSPLSAAVTPVAGGFDLLAGIGGADVREADDERRLVDRLIAALEAVDRPYDVALFDLGAGLGAGARALLLAVDRVLLVLSTEAAALVDAYGLYKWLVQAGQAAVFVVPNRVPDEAAGRRLAERFGDIAEHFLGRRPELLGVVREDDVIARAARQGVPPFPLPERSRARRDFAGLAVRLVARAGGKDPDRSAGAPAPPAAAGRPFGALVARLKARLFSS